LIPQLNCFNPKTDADFRAITPPGFANLFFEANNIESKIKETKQLRLFK